MAPDPTTTELKAAWRRGLLWRCGISYQRAITTPLLLRVLTHSALAHRKTHPGPTQLNLTQEKT